MIRIAHDLQSPHSKAKLRDMVGAVIYIRVTKEQTENLSLSTQLESAKSTVGTKVSRSSNGSKKRAKVRNRLTAPNCSDS